jgi:senataxin
MVCAPSNAAVDEITLRVAKEGLWNRDGNVFVPSIVRVGVAASISEEARKYSVDSLVDNRMSVFNAQEANAQKV